MKYLHNIDPERVVMIERQINKSAVYTVDGAVQYFEKSLVWFESKFRILTRCHRSYMVNPEFVEKVDGDTVHMKGGYRAMLSKKEGYWKKRFQVATLH